MNEKPELFFSTFELSLPLIHRIAMKKIHNEDINNEESKNYACWGVTDALELLLRLREGRYYIQVVHTPNKTKEFIREIEKYLDSYHLLIFSQEGELCHWFAVLYSNNSVYIIEYGGKENGLIIDKQYRDDFIDWIKQLVERKITDRFYGQHISGLRMIVIDRKRLSLTRIGNFITRNINILE